MKQELEAERKALIEFEERRKEENEELVHLYVDIEVIICLWMDYLNIKETKNNIIKEIIQIKSSKEKLNQERKELEAERKEIFRYKEMMSK